MTGPRHGGLQPKASVSTRLINQLIHFGIKQPLLYVEEALFEC